MSSSPIKTAISQICQEKNLSEDDVLHAIELALAAAYRKDFGNKMQNIFAEFDPTTGGVKVTDVKTVVDDLPAEVLEEMAKKEEYMRLEREEGSVESNKIKEENKKPIKQEGSESKDTYVSEGENEQEYKFNPKTEIQLSDAKKIDKNYKVGDEIVTSLEVPGEFGRMAAQTAKQVIIQRLREIEREHIYEEYKQYEHQVLSGAVQRREGINVLVDLEKTTAVMPPEEQVYNERYSVGNRMKFYVVSVDQTARGPQIIVSRSHPEVVRKIFETEIPEVTNGTIEIKSIAREAGNRSKIAIWTEDENIDPIGSCVGQRGSRIQTIISELNGEKVDIISWEEDPAKFITNALSPAKVMSVELKEDIVSNTNEASEEPQSDEAKKPETDEADNNVKDKAIDEAEQAEQSESDQPKTIKMATVMVKKDQLSLAIGRNGQNVRLASKLTGWKLNIDSDEEEAEQTETDDMPTDPELNEETGEQNEIDDKDKKKKKQKKEKTKDGDEVKGKNKKSEK